jgi:inorganic triphosphatase YgiF
MGDVTAGVESERKYDVPDGAELPRFDDLRLTATASRFRLVAAYHDTEDGVLAANRMTLRRREGGHDAGWHLKTPGDDGRVEHQMPLADRVPPELRAVVSDLLQDREVVEVARLETDRTAVTLVDASGAEVAEIADDRVVGTDARAGTERRWREWEAELLDGAPSGSAERNALLDRLEAVLVDAGAVPSPSPSKLARATGRAALPAF